MRKVKQILTIFFEIGAFSMERKQAAEGGTSRGEMTGTAVVFLPVFENKYLHFPQRGGILIHNYR